jgi:YidC/Oxa1 family membrane protein insertase
MHAWLVVVDLFRELVFLAAHLFGGSIGAGVLAVSFATRLALLPLTLKVARRVREHQRRVKALAPELDRLRRRYGSDRARLAEETLTLYRRRGVRMVPGGVSGSIAIQLPISLALYQAVAQGIGRGARFLWIRDLAAPDPTVAVVAATLAGLAAMTGDTPQSRAAFALSAGVTFIVAWRLSATVGLYWVASSGVSAVQTLLMRRASEPAG